MTNLYSAVDSYGWRTIWNGNKYVYKYWIERPPYGWSWRSTRVHGPNEDEDRYLPRNWTVI